MDSRKHMCIAFQRPRDTPTIYMLAQGGRLYHIAIIAWFREGTSQPYELEEFVMTGTDAHWDLLSCEL